MANTADTLGEQETLDKLVSHTLENFEDDRIKKVASYALHQNDGIKYINLPNVDTLSEYGLARNHNLEIVKIPKYKNSFYRYIFQKCEKLNNVDISSQTDLGTSEFNCCYSLNSIDLQKLTILSHGYALSNTGIGTLVLPNVEEVSNNNIVEGVRISTIDFPKLKKISSSVFYNAYSLVHLILRNETLCSLSSTSAFTNTPIANGLGWIYVPSNLVDSYKSASNWSTYANQIVSLEEYPKVLSGETITDSWDEIFQAESDGSYKTKYSVGDTKYLVIGGTYVLMQIIAFDRDILSSDHTSTAKITWLSKGLSFEFPINFTDTTTGGWADCECRKFLSDTIYGQIPENVRNKILAVDKTYTVTVESVITATVSDKLWIPSIREISGSGYNYENSGISYNDFFKNYTLKPKTLGLTGKYSSYFMRSNYNGFRVINDSGSDNNTCSPTRTSDIKIALGFCT